MYCCSPHWQWTTPKLTSSASIRFSRRSSYLGLQRQKRTYGKKGREFHKSQRPESGLIWLRSKTLLYSRKCRSWDEPHTERRAHTTSRYSPCQGKHKVNHNIDKQFHNSISLSDFNNRARHVESCNSTCFQHTNRTLHLSVAVPGCLSLGLSIHLAGCLNFRIYSSLCEASGMTDSFVNDAVLKSW